jgi:hypothetical protein
MKTIKSLLSIAIVAMIFTSCKKDASGPAAVDFQLQATSTTSTLQRTTAATIQWTAGNATPSSVKFEAKQNSSQIEFTSTASQQIDLFNLTQSTFGNLNLPAGNYSEIELKVQVNALQLSGIYNNGTANIPVVFSVTSPLLIKTESSNVAVSGGAFTAVTALTLSNFTSGITQTMLNSATQTGGNIVISASSNASLYNIIISNINQFHHTEFNHH